MSEREYDKCPACGSWLLVEKRDRYDRPICVPCMHDWKAAQARIRDLETALSAKEGELKAAMGVVEAVTSIGAEVWLPTVAEAIEEYERKVGQNV